MAPSQKAFAGVAIILINFSLLSAGQTPPSPSLVSGISNWTIIQGETLNLTCVFAESVSNDYNVLYKKDDDRHIGRCQQGYPCFTFHEFNTSRIKIAEEERLTFRLEIHNMSYDDMGKYECGLENRIFTTLNYSSLSKGYVTVADQNEIRNPSCRVFLPDNGPQESQVSRKDLATLQCGWLADYANVTSEWILSSDEGFEENATTWIDETTQGIQRSIYLEEYSNYDPGSARCEMQMPGLSARLSCNFPTIQQINIDSKTRTGTFICSGARSEESVSWFVLANGNLKGSDEHSHLITSYSNNISMINISDVTAQHNGSTILCTSVRDASGRQRVILAMGKVVVSIKETNERLRPPSSLSENGIIPQATVETDIASQTKPGAKVHLSNQASQITYSESSARASKAEMPLGFVYASAAASLLALIIAMVALFRTCRRKSPKKQDTERAEAKVAPISNDIYATIDPADFTKSRGEDDEKDALRLLENEAAEQALSNPSSKTIGFLRATSVIHALPTGACGNCKPKRRTQSENNGHQIREPLSAGGMCNKPIAEDIVLSHSNCERCSPIDESTLNSCRTGSTLNSRQTESTDEGTRDIVYYGLEKTSSSDEEMVVDDVDNRTADSSIAEETTLGIVDEHDYFSLEQESKDEQATSNGGPYENSVSANSRWEKTTSNGGGYDNLASPIKSRNGRMLMEPRSEQTESNDNGYDNLVSVKTRNNQTTSNDGGYECPMAIMTTTTNKNNNSFGEETCPSGYDNFRGNRVPHLPKEDSGPVTSIYDKLDPTAQYF